LLLSLGWRRRRKRCKVGDRLIYDDNVKEVKEALVFVV
jgi:hypothetical protein